MFKVVLHTIHTTTHSNQLLIQQPKYFTKPNFNMVTRSCVLYNSLRQAKNLDVAYKTFSPFHVKFLHLRTLFLMNCFKKQRNAVVYCHSDTRLMDCDLLQK